MKVLVPIKRVIDANIKVRVKADNTGVELNNVKMAMNPFCEIAVEEAIRMREAGTADEVIVVAVGPSQSQETLRTGLAMGADRAILIETDPIPEPLAIAKLLKTVAEKEEPGMILLGKQAIDGDCNQVGQLLGEYLGQPQACFASEVSVSDGRARVTREVDGGLETIDVARQTAVVNGHYSFCVRRDRVFDLIDIEVVRLWIDIDETDRGTGLEDRRTRADERVGAGDDLVTDPDPGGTTGGFQGHRAPRAGHTILRILHRCEGFLELLDLRAVVPGTGFEDLEENVPFGLVVVGPGV